MTKAISEISGVLCEDHQNSSVVYECYSNKFCCCSCLSKITLPNTKFINAVDIQRVDDEKELMNILGIEDTSPQSLAFICGSNEIQQKTLEEFHLFSSSLLEINDSILKSQQFASLVSQTKNNKEIISNIREEIKNQLVEGQSLSQISFESQKQQIQNSLNDFNSLKIDFLKQIDKQFHTLDQLVFETKINLFKILGECTPIPITFPLSNSVSSLENENKVMEYKIKGAYGLFSNEIIPIDRNRKYLIKMEVKNCSNQITYTGWRSQYGKEIIYDCQQLVKCGTELKLVRIDEQNKALIVDNSNNNLSKWNAGTTSYACKYIAYYKNGDISAFIPRKYLITHNGDTSQSAYKEIDETNGKILLTDWGWAQFKNIFSESDLNNAYLMNHTGGGIYDYTEEITTHISSWIKREYTVSQFKNFTDQISVCLLANYRGDSEKIFEIRNVTITLLPN